MFFDPEVRFEAILQRRCLNIAEEIVDEIQFMPADAPNMTPPATVPKDTGKLMEGYSSKHYENGAEVVNDVSYWKYVEGRPKGEYEHAQPHVDHAKEFVKTAHRRGF